MPKLRRLGAAKQLSEDDWELAMCSNPQTQTSKESEVVRPQPPPFCIKALWAQCHKTNNSNHARKIAAVSCEPES